MEEIKVGEYIRNENGVIDKIIDYDKQNNLFITKKGFFIDPEDKLGMYMSNVVNHSFDIIDLIEVGDIVDILVNEKEILRYIIDTESDLCLLRKDAIQTILTKEQFEENSYKIERN